MSTYVVTEIIDDSVDQEFTTSKSGNLEWIKTQFVKYGNPVGTMKLQILNDAKDTVLAESTSMNCDYATETDYDGVDADYNMSYIRFDFAGEAIKTGVTYNARILCDSTYYAGYSASDNINTVIDYPKSTNRTDTSFETTKLNNFTKYPLLVLEIFTRSY